MYLCKAPEWFDKLSPEVRAKCARQRWRRDGPRDARVLHTASSARADDSSAAAASCPLRVRRIERDKVMKAFPHYETLDLQLDVTQARLAPTSPPMRLLNAARRSPLVSRALLVGAQPSRVAAAA